MLQLMCGKRKITVCVWGTLPGSLIFISDLTDQASMSFESCMHSGSLSLACLHFCIERGREKERKRGNEAFVLSFSTMLMQCKCNGSCLPLVLLSFTYF